MAAGNGSLRFQSHRTGGCEEESKRAENDETARILRVTLLRDLLVIG